MFNKFRWLIHKLFGYKPWPPVPFDTIWSISPLGQELLCKLLSKFFEGSLEGFPIILSPFGELPEVREWLAKSLYGQGWDFESLSPDKQKAVEDHWIMWAVPLLALTLDEICIGIDHGLKENNPELWGQLERYYVLYWPKPSQNDASGPQAS